jgi:hypothetical protein
VVKKYSKGVVGKDFSTIQVRKNLSQETVSKSTVCRMIHLAQDDAKCMGEKITV